MSNRTTDEPSPEHQRPAGVSDETVQAVGKISEGLEAVEAARGHLYSFHRLTGTADLTLGEGVEELRRAGHPDLADRIDRELVGRNVLFGRWTFQVVEEYDDGYYATFRELERLARAELVGGAPAPLRGRDEGTSSNPRAPAPHRSPRGRGWWKPVAGIR